MKLSIAAVREKFLRLQNEIVGALSTLDGGTDFHGKDLESFGGGLSRPRVLSNGKHIEKAAVQFTHSLGQSLPPAATERNPALEGFPFQATSISVIVHPRNPHVPTTHMNLRFFLIEAEVPVWYFGGGFDLTPYYPYREDVVQWHQNARSACGSDERYRNLKTQCDDYISCRIVASRAASVGSFLTIGPKKDLNRVTRSYPALATLSYSVTNRFFSVE